MPILPAPRTEEALDELLSRPDAGAVKALAAQPGDVLVLGVGGKMGPSLARMLRRAADEADGRRDARRIIGVSRFSSPKARTALDAVGVETIPCDLSDAGAARDPYQVEKIADVSARLMVVSCNRPADCVAAVLSRL